MASRRDELRAHQFLKQRAVSALVIHETDPETPPFRRPTVASYWSLGLALLGLAAAGVVGLFVHSSSTTKFKEGQNVILVNGAGAPYVFLSGELHYTMNKTSALLAIGKNVPTQSVDASQLDDVPRGPDLGIDGAPGVLPGKGNLLKGGWTLCSDPTKSASGNRVNNTVLLVGGIAAGGQGTADSAVMVRFGSSQYLLWHGYRHLVADRRVVIGLGLSSASVIPVSQTLLNTMPTGARLAPLKVPGFGSLSSAIPEEPGVRTGDVLFVQLGGSTRQYYLVQRNRLQPITEFQYEIQRATLHTALKEIDPSALPPAVQTDTPLSESAPPVSHPTFIRPRTTLDAVCGLFAPGASVPAVSVGARVPAGGRAVGGTGPTNTPLADRVVVRGGWAALVEIVGDQAAKSGTLAYVGDNGLLYPLSDSGVPAILGYAGVKPVRLSAGVAARMPLGPPLSAQAARQPHN
jgi:type VII secretion protein EccB